VFFGPTGVGKTVACLQSIFRGIGAGEKGLFVALGESPSELSSIASGFGWDLEKAVDEGMLTLLYFASDQIYIDEFGNIVLKFRDFVYALVKRLGAQRVASLFTYEVPDLFRVTGLSPRGVSHMAENVVMLNYVKTDASVDKLITVLKTRSSRHDELGRKYVITAEGLVAA
jgi:circadian clock protein KaiC